MATFLSTFSKRGRQKVYGMILVLKVCLCHWDGGNVVKSLKLASHVLLRGISDLSILFMVLVFFCLLSRSISMVYDV